MADRYAVKATETSFEIVEAIRERDGATITELATALDLSKSAVHKHLQTLHRLGYLARSDNTYTVGLKFLDQGTLARERHPLYEAGRDQVDNLCRTAGETASLVVRDQECAVFLYSAESEGGSRLPVRDGQRVPLAECAAGRAILAYSPAGDDQAASRPSRDDGLARELRTVRDQGLALGRSEIAEGTRSVAAPIRGGEREVVGAVCVTGAVDELTGKRLEEDVSGLVLSTAQSVENRLSGR